MTFVETTTPALADSGTRGFDLVTDDDRVQLLALYQEDVSLYDEEPCLKVTGNIASNEKLGRALIDLGNKLISTMGNKL